MIEKIRHICFADDDPDDHFLFTHAIQEQFPNIVLYPFYICDDLLRFLEDENKPAPDLIFLDLNIPGNMELECLKKIRQMTSLMHVPVLIYSTSDSEASMTKSLTLGADKYVVKPYSYQQLKKTVGELIIEYEEKND